jgi:hypothetical protein
MLNGLILLVLFMIGFSASPENGSSAGTSVSKYSAEAVTPLDSDSVSDPAAKPTPKATPTPTQPNPKFWPYALSRSLRSQTHPLGDYVPCMFDAEDEAEFRGILLGNLANQAAQKEIQSSTLPEQTKKSASNAVNETPLYSMGQIQSLSEKLDAIKRQQPTVEAQQNVETVKNKVEAATTAALSPIQRPTDVSCSLAVLPWDIAKDSFGRHFANTFMIVQITVRNLNKDDEFLLHDVQVAVDTQPGTLNHFQAAINQPIARGVGTTGQVLSARNFAVRLAEFLGSVASSSSIPAGPSFKDGVAVFTGAFIPAFKTLLPDQTIEQLARIDELTFSASSNRRIVVGTRQSVTFITLIPTKPIQRIDFGCIYEKQANENLSNCSIQHKSWLRSIFTLGFSTPASDPTTYLRSKSKDFKSWTPTDLLALQNNTYAIVAGVHVKESPSQTTFETLDCPQRNADGTLNLSTTDPNYICKLSGDQLQLVPNIILKSSTESTSTSTATGTVSVSGDPKHADVTFKTADLKKLSSGTYTVFYPATTGEQRSTTIQIKIGATAGAAAPVGPVSDIKPNPVPAESLKTDPVTFTAAFDPEKAGQLCIYVSDQKAECQPLTDAKDSPNGKKTGTAKFAAKQLAGLTTGKKYPIGYLPKGDTDAAKASKVEGLTIEVSPPNPAASPGKGDKKTTKKNPANPVQPKPKPVVGKQPQPAPTRSPNP